MICTLSQEILLLMRIQKNICKYSYCHFVSYCARSAEIDPLKPAAVWHKITKTYIYGTEIYHTDK